MFLLTYDGDIKPPDLAFVGAVNGWRYPPFGYDVKRIDYKIYEVMIANTD